MAVSDSTQENIVSNKARHLIFIEGDNLCYNYKTGQWSLVSAYDTLSFYTINDRNGIIGLVRFSGGAATLQKQSTSLGETQTATFETAEKDLNESGRTEITGTRPLVNGGTVTSRIGVRDDLTTSVSYRTGTAVNSRTGMINYRNAGNGPAEGRYVRAEYTITGGFDSALGADVEFESSGGV